METTRGQQTLAAVSYLLDQRQKGGEQFGASVWDVQSLTAEFAPMHMEL